MADPIPADYENVRKRKEIRCGCTAHMIVKYYRTEKKFYIAKWDGEHSGHNLVPKELSYLQRSNRRVDLHEGFLAELNDSVGIPLDRSYHLFCQGAGGARNVGYLKVDLKNHLRTKRENKMDSSEAVCVQQYMQNACRKSPGFFYEIQYDGDNLITNIFWVDSRMIMDYTMFGDSVTFDTTYRTNRTYRPLALFAGFNNHRQIIVFGAALLYDETIALFEWLFRTFMGCMNNCAPVTIFTDQDTAMPVAIKSTLPTTSHFLCTRHILQNAKKNLHSTLQESVSHSLVHLMYHVEDENEFNHCWREMMTTHFRPTNHGPGLIKSKIWLQKLKLKHEQWSNAWVRKRFTAGMRSMQASESVNDTIRGFLKSDQRLSEFFPHFEEMIENIRQRENLSKFESLDKVPVNMFKLCPIACMASSIYTPTITNWFHYEREQCYGYLISRNTAADEGQVEVWFVYKMDEVCQPLDRQVVHYDSRSSLLRCSCSIYESVGILCRHILTFMVLMGGMGNLQLRTLPDNYILTRWTKDARSSFLGDWFVENKSSSTPTNYVRRYQRMTATPVSIASVVSYDANIYTEVMGELCRLLKISKEKMKYVNLKAQRVGQSPSAIAAPDLTPGNIVDDRPCVGIKMRPVRPHLKKRPRSMIKVIHQRLRAKHLRNSDAASNTGPRCDASPTMATPIFDIDVNNGDAPLQSTAPF